MFAYLVDLSVLAPSVVRAWLQADDPCFEVRTWDISQWVRMLAHMSVSPCATHWIRWSWADKKCLESCLYYCKTAWVLFFQGTQAIISWLSLLMKQICCMQKLYGLAGVVIYGHTSHHFVLITAHGSDLACRSFSVDLAFLASTVMWTLAWE